MGSASSLVFSNAELKLGSTNDIVVTIIKVRLYRESGSVKNVSIIHAKLSLLHYLNLRSVIV